MYQIGDQPFHQTFCSVYFGFIFLIFWIKYHHDNKYECILLVKMQHSQPHITLYCADIFLSYDGKNLHGVESLMAILLSESIDFLSPPYFSGLTIILWSYQIETCNNTFGTNFVSEGPSKDTLRQSLEIGYCTNWVFYRIQSYRLFYLVINFGMSAPL